MRVISGFVAATMLVALSQPAWAVCINRGGAVTCHDDPKYWQASVGPEKAENSDADAGASVKTIVLESRDLSGNAWVMTPQSGGGAITPAGADAGVPACELGVNC
jgi:hypothetical protein